MSYTDMLNDAARAADQRAANATLRRAEHDHGRSMALLVAALAKLRKVAPASLVLVPQVQAKIRAKGGLTIDRSPSDRAPSFQAVWNLEFNLPLILAEVQREHDAEKEAIIGKLEAAQAVSKLYFFLPWKTYGQVRVRVRGRWAWAKFKFPTVEAAEAARLRALKLARGVKLGGELGIERLLRAQ